MDGKSSKSGYSGLVEEPDSWTWWYEKFENLGRFLWTAPSDEEKFIFETDEVGFWWKVSVGAGGGVGVDLRRLNYLDFVVGELFKTNEIWKWFILGRGRDNDGCRCLNCCFDGLRPGVELTKARTIESWVEEVNHVGWRVRTA